MDLRDFMLCITEAKGGSQPAKDALPWVADQYAQSLLIPKEVIPLPQYLENQFPDTPFKVDFFTKEQGDPLQGRMIYNDPSLDSSDVMKVLADWAVESNTSVEISVINDGAS